MTIAFSFTQAATISFSATAQSSITVADSGGLFLAVVPAVIDPPQTYYLLTAASERLTSETGYAITTEHV